MNKTNKNRELGWWVRSAGDSAAPADLAGVCILEVHVYIWGRRGEG